VRLPYFNKRLLTYLLTYKQSRGLRCNVTEMVLHRDVCRLHITVGRVLSVPSKNCPKSSLFAVFNITHSTYCSHSHFISLAAFCCLYEDVAYFAVVHCVTRAMCKCCFFIKRKTPVHPFLLNAVRIRTL